MDSKTAADSPIEATLATKYRIDRQKHILWLILFSASIVGSFVLSVDSPTAVSVGGHTLPELCFTKRITGMSCPGCGMTRSFISMAHGNGRAAWAFHPAGPIWFVVFAAQIPYRSWQLWRLHRGKSEFVTGYERHAIASMLAVVFLGWIFRSLVGA
ncbi:MAG: DUF2752 domain-containing protein [Planctomycetales bacterium]|nr:DUF2752 domain-containing protein [Planctomycetales bacterium]